MPKIQVDQGDFLFGKVRVESVLIGLECLPHEQREVIRDEIDRLREAFDALDRSYYGRDVPRSMSR